MDIGKYKYDLQKKLIKQKNQRISNLKELKLRPGTEQYMIIILKLKMLKNF